MGLGKASASAGGERSLTKSHGVWSRVRRGRGSSRHRVTADLDTVSSHLRPGRWESALTSSGSSVPSLLSRRVGADTSSLGGLDRELVRLRRSGSSDFATFSEWWSVDACEGIAVPSANHRFLADVVVRRHGAKWLLFDLEQYRVIRLVEQDQFSVAWEALRRIFSRFVPSVPFTVLSGRMASVEPILLGPTADQAAPLDTALAEIFEEGLFRLAEEANLGPSEDLLHAALNRSAVPAVNAEADRILDLCGEWPLVPVHNDLVPDHVVLTEDGPCLIDFGGLTVGLPSADHRGALLGRLAQDGPEGDREFALFQERIGVQRPRVPDGWPRLVEMAEFALLESESVFALHSRSTKAEKWSRKWVTKSENRGWNVD